MLQALAVSLSGVVVPAPTAMTTVQLERMDWAHRSSSFGALFHQFAVRTTDINVGWYVTELLAAMTSPQQPAGWYSLVNQRASSGQQCALYWRTARLTVAPHAAEAVSWLLHHANRYAIETCARDLVLHAAAAEHEGHALLFPAAPGSGKSTLVAGLIRAGLRYLTDDAAAVDLQSLRVRPYPKPIAIEPGSQDVLRDLEPSSAPAGAGRAWQVPVSAIRGGSVADAAPPSFVVAPRYQAGAVTSLVPMRPAEAVMVLAENSFNLLSHGQVGLEALALVVQRSQCYRLTVGDLDVACRLVLELVGAVGPRGDPPGAIASRR